MEIYIPVIVIGIIAVVLALSIGIVVKVFGKAGDPIAEQISELMPGANCGGCGFAGCGDYANAMARKEAVPGRCPSMSSEAMEKICGLLGVSGEKAEPKVAVVCCSGDDGHAKHQAFYNGVSDCLNAMIVAGGAKGCTFGCLGLGTCARACPFGAIEITEGHLAFVHSEICVGCGKCMSVCPRHIIKLVPRSAPVHVFCSSPEKYPLKKQVCSSGCMGCKKCQRAAGEEHITMNGALAVVNYDNPPVTNLAAGCPTKCLRIAAGHEHDFVEAARAEAHIEAHGGEEAANASAEAARQAK